MTLRSMNVFKCQTKGRGNAGRREHPGKFPKRNLHPKDFPEDVCAQGRFRGGEEQGFQTSSRWLLSGFPLT